MFNKSSFAKGIQSFSTLCREDVFLETARVSAEGKRTESRDGDNFQTLKMISGQNAAGQGLKWPVGSERGVERDVGREKLVYKHKLRKYITKCNGESEVAAWSAPGKSGLFNPREGNPRHLLCYIVTRKLRFYKRTQLEQRATKTRFLSQFLPPVFQRASFLRNLSHFHAILLQNSLQFPTNATTVY